MFISVQKNVNDSMNCECNIHKLFRICNIFALKKTQQIPYFYIIIIPRAEPLMQICSTCRACQSALCVMFSSKGV